MRDETIFILADTRLAAQLVAIKYGLRSSDFAILTEGRHYFPHNYHEPTFDSTVYVQGVGALNNLVHLSLVLLAKKVIYADR